jgi:hypothetical protein
MRVKARKHVRNEGSRQFKSAPLRQAYMDPARVQGLNCRHDLELGCSHISGLLVGHQMKPRALMDFRALRSAISLAASRAMLGDRVGKRRSDRFTISVIQRTLRNLGKSGFQCHISP